MKLANLIHAKRMNHNNSTSSELGQKERFHLFVTNMKCDIYDPSNKSNHPKVGNAGSSLSLVTSTLQEIYTGTPNPYLCLISDPVDLLHHPVDRGWRLFWNNAIQRTLRMKSSPKKRNHKSNHHTCFLNTYGFPRSSVQRQRYEAEWDHNEEIHTEIRTHHNDGSPIDMTGAMLHLSVMDHRHSRSVIHQTTSAVTGVVTDYVIGTVSINLVDLMRQCRIPSAHRKVATTRVPVATSTKSDGSVEVQMASHPSNAETKSSTTILTEMADTVKVSVTSTKSNNTTKSVTRNDNNIDDDDDDDPIVRVEIDEAIIKNGIETGRLQCQLEIWWTDGTIIKAFTPYTSSTTSINSNAGGGTRRQQRRINNRSNSYMSDTSASNFPRRPPIAPDRRTAATTV
jgi:hypothetical protein